MLYFYIALANEIITFLFFYKYVTAFQQFGYKTKEYFKWILGGGYKPEIKINAKVPLKFTKRIIRLLITLFIVSLIMPFFLLPINVIIANYIALPLESAIKGFYILRAKGKIKKFNGLVIGITGSYGKTSVKEILYIMLSVKYKVLKTPNSFNTPMGISKTVKKLDNGYDVFIAEMGAKKVGDIKQLAKICRPKIGIITGINSQHLSSFGSIENIIKTKNELIENLNDGGIAFYGEDKNCQKLFKRNNGEKYISNVNVSDIKSLVSFGNVSLSEEGSSFILKFSSGKELQCTTALLGEHNVKNVCLCALICYKLGLSEEQIRSGISKLKPIPHRLEIIKGEKAIVIDDGYNSNENGAKASLKVLSGFSGRKIVVSPGLIELGKSQSRINFGFAKEVAKSCDIFIIVGTVNRTSLKNGFCKSDRNKKLYTVDTLEEAKRILLETVKKGDVVLFENDLLDYN